MFCRKCGSENLDGAKFCRKCGATLVAEKNIYANNSINTMPTFIPSSSSSNTNKDVYKIVIGAVLALIVVIVAIYYRSMNSDVLDFDKYIEVSSSGYDGNGEASLYIDWDRIDDDYHLEFTKKGREELDFYDTPIEFLKDYISYPELDTSSGLSNGDIVDYNWYIGEDGYSATKEEIQQYVKCKIKFQSGSIKISGLDEITTFDVFDDLEVTIYGNPPDNRVEVEYHGEYFDDYDFDVNPNYNLKDGDIVTVSLDDDAIKQCISYYGKKPSSKSKKYTVSGAGDNLYNQSTDSQNGYLCTYSSERLMTRDEIVSYQNTDYSSYNFPGGRSIVQMLINEIFARHGYYFEDQELYNYFYNNSLFSNVTIRQELDMDGVFNTMSSVEQDNLRLLMEYR